MCDILNKFDRIWTKKITNTLIVFLLYRKEAKRTSMKFAIILCLLIVHTVADQYSEHPTAGIHTYNEGTNWLPKLKLY